MHLGVFFFPTDYSIRIDQLARALEQRGFESLFVCEHTHIPASRLSPWPGGSELPREYSNTLDPFVALSCAAAVTDRLRLGTGICLLPQHETIVTAKAIASLDQLSNGRFIFGIGGGWNKEEMENHGVAYDKRFRMMRERVLAMKAIWTEKEATFHGEFENFDAIWSNPKPVQQPHPPILLGGETDYTLKRVIEYCDGWFPRVSPRFDPVEGMSRLRAMAEQHGRDTGSLSVSVFRAPPDRGVLDSYADAGIDRVLLQLPSDPPDSVLSRLDDYATLLN